MRKRALFKFCQPKGLRLGFEWHGKKVEGISESNIGSFQLNEHDFSTVKNELRKKELTLQPLEGKETVITTEIVCHDNSTFM